MSTNKNKSPSRPESVPHRFQGQEIRRMLDGGAVYFSARDLGRALGYDSDGGNLSRNFAHAGAWREMFVEGEDYTRDTRGAIWLTSHGVLQTLRLVVAIEREDRAALADLLLRRWWQNERRARRAA